MNNKRIVTVTLVLDVEVDEFFPNGAASRAVFDRIHSLNLPSGVRLDLIRSVKAEDKK